jgi:hypothetical protein
MQYGVAISMVAEFGVDLAVAYPKINVEVTIE